LDLLLTASYLPASGSVPDACWGPEAARRASTGTIPGSLVRAAVPGRGEGCLRFRSRHSFRLFHSRNKPLPKQGRLESKDSGGFFQDSEGTFVSRIALREDPVARALQAVDQDVEMAPRKLLTASMCRQRPASFLQRHVVDRERPLVTKRDLVRHTAHSTDVFLSQAIGPIL